MKRLLVLSAVLLLSCTEDTGSGLIQFAAYAGGQERADDNGPYEFDSAAGYHVVLEKAEFVIGALYLNRAKPIMGAQDTACILAGLYTGEVRSEVTIDALSPNLVAFPELGDGTLERVLTGEVWLTGGAIDVAHDPTKILQFSGIASRESLTYRFYGTTTIGQNRSSGSADPATPGANPMCKQRIVTPIPVDFQPTKGGHLSVRVKPSVWFDRVDFASLPGATGSGEELEIPDSVESATSSALLSGIRSTAAYRFEWQP